MATTTTSARSVLLDWLLRACAVVGLGASAVLVWEYTQTSNLFCGPGEGCDLVRASRFASIGGIHTPYFAALFFACVLVLVLVPSRLARRALTILAVAGGLAGLGLFFEQALVIRAFCVYCCIGDVAQLSIAVLAIANREPAQPLGRSERLSFAVLFLVGFGAPFLFGLVTHPRSAVADDHTRPVPACVTSESGGAVTIVEFIDFECPYCRAQHFALARLLSARGAELGRPVRVVRKHFPLPAHRFAKDAARIAICAEDAGRGELMNDILFSADDLSLAALQASASQLGIDPTSLQACLGSADTTHRLEEDASCGHGAQINALPTFFVGNQRFEGLQKDDAIFAALQRAVAVANAAKTTTGTNATP